MMQMGTLIKRLLDEAFDTNTVVSIAPKGNGEQHFDIESVEVVEDDSDQETGHRLVLHMGSSVDSRYRMEKEADAFLRTPAGHKAALDTRP